MSRQQCKLQFYAYAGIHSSALHTISVCFVIVRLVGNILRVDEDRERITRDHIFRIGIPQGIAAQVDGELIIRGRRHESVVESGACHLQRSTDEHAFEGTYAGRELEGIFGSSLQTADGRILCGQLLCGLACHISVGSPGRKDIPQVIGDLCFYTMVVLFITVLVDDITGNRVISIDDQVFNSTVKIVGRERELFIQQKSLCAGFDSVGLFRLQRRVGAIWTIQLIDRGRPEAG